MEVDSLDLEEELFLLARDNDRMYDTYSVLQCSKELTYIFAGTKAMEGQEQFLSLLLKLWPVRTSGPTQFTTSRMVRCCIILAHRK